MIEIKDIKKSFNGVEVLKGITATFETGKTNLIIGQSGSGKTVLLKTLLGIHTQDSGTISFDGKFLKQMNLYYRRKLITEFRMLYQVSALLNSMTIEDNIGYQ